MLQILTKNFGWMGSVFCISNLPSYSINSGWYRDVESHL